MTVQISTLGNGMRVVTDTMKEVDSITLGVWVKVGSRYESLKNNGISHLLEHMAFKGTENRTALQIAEEIENVGGFINAYTSREITAYHVKLLKEDFELGAEIIADILLNSNFPEDELEREKGVIIQEINRSNDDPTDLVFDHFQSSVYKGQPLGYTILGPAQNIRNTTRKTIFDYMRHGYTGPRMVFSVCGNIGHEKVVKTAEKLFSGVSPTDRAKARKARYTAGESRQTKKHEQVNLLLGWEGVSHNDKDYYAASLLSNILGSGMSSRLFQEIREKRGLVYSIYSFSSSYDDTGVFGVYAGTGEKEVKELIPATCVELKKTLTDRITSEEIERCKNIVRSAVLMRREDNDGRCRSNASQVLFFGRVISKEEMLKHYGKITDKDLKRVAARIFSSTPSMASLGPVKHVAPYAAFKKMMKA